MKVYLKLGDEYVGLSPDNPETVYADRATGGAWEELELTRHDGGHFDAKFIAADRQLSLAPGGVESRPAGTYGAWELPFATAQPDGSKLLYRTEGGVIVGPVLTLEEV